MQGDGTSIVGHELAKGIRKLKKKLGAKQLAEAYSPEEAETTGPETDLPGEEPAGGVVPADMSLLWPPGAAAPPPETWLDDNSARDLGLEDTVAGIVRRSSGREDRQAIKDILLQVCRDPDVIRYRQDVVEDLLRYPELAAGFEKLLPKLAELNQYGQAEQQEINLYRVTWWLGELELYLECVRLLGQIFETVDRELSSAGLRQLRETIAAIQAGPTYTNLERELPGLLARMRGVGSITIGVNLDDKLQPVAATLIAVNEEKFTEAPLLKMLLGRAGGQEGVMPIHAAPTVVTESAVPFSPTSIKTNPLMVPLFRDLSQVLERVSEPVVQALRKYIQLNRHFLSTLGPELAFYLGAVRLLADLASCGLPVCRPELAPVEERLCRVENNYNLNLALQLLDRQGRRDLDQHIVQNDVSLDEAGRIIILTGPNRGGKTTYTQAIGLTQVLAQAGLHVPGSRARLSPADGVYTHFPLEEKLDKGTGRFGDEARRLHQLFTRATRHSLILLNESLSGTAAGESLYLARDIVRIIRLMGGRAVFATHLHELADSVDRLNADTAGDSQIISMVASPVSQPDSAGPEAEIKRSYKVIPSPPAGRSYAREIAARYGISFEQLKELLEQRGIT